MRLLLLFTLLINTLNFNAQNSYDKDDEKVVKDFIQEYLDINKKKDEIIVPISL